MNLNPETNPKVRAVLYGIGTAGFAHITTMFLLAIIKKRPEFTSPMFLLDLDLLLPNLKTNPLAYLAGWLVLVTIIYTAYRLITRRK